MNILTNTAIRIGTDPDDPPTAAIPAPKDFLAIATAKSFGDFVIAHSVLHGVEQAAKGRIRLISNSNVKALHAVLPDDVPVTLVDSDAERVPALFDIRKRGALAMVQSALSLRREFQKIERKRNEVLIFAAFGVRERFIAGRWPVLGPRTKGRNIYETYLQLLDERCIRAEVAAIATPVVTARSVGVFPESRLAEKRLSTSTLAAIFDRAASAGLDATLFILEGDVSPEQEFHRTTYIPRNFASLAAAINSVDSVISADSLPAHLAEYFGRPTFVALPAPNEYWMPYRCFTKKHWGVFAATATFSASLDTFFRQLQSV